MSSLEATVAVITDIHGNLPALQATLARIDELDIERIFCGGDLVGYGPHPNEICAMIARREIPTIYGNYDYAIARDEEDCGCAYVTAHDRELGQQSVDWTLAHTNQESKNFMRDLPFDLSFPVGDVDADPDALAASDAWVLVLDPEANVGVAGLARELGATYAVSGFVPPPVVADLLTRWVALAARRIERDGWSRTSFPETETEPWSWLADLLEYQIGADATAKPAQPDGLLS